VGIEYLLARWGDDDDLADLRDAVRNASVLEPLCSYR
jgi:hypothetical protein